MDPALKQALKEENERVQAEAEEVKRELQAIQRENERIKAQIALLEKAKRDRPVA